MLSEGQRLGLKQFEEIVGYDSYALEVVDVYEPTADYSFTRVDISLYCGQFVKKDGGLPLRERERFRVFIPKDFPFSHPSVHTLHTRFAGYPHVQWKKSLCLYQSPQTEWTASDGMYGFIARLEDWLKHAAVDELDPVGGALHPPVAYPSSESDTIIVPKANTPIIKNRAWLGLAELQRINEKALSIKSWVGIGADTPSGNYAATILLADPLSFEYPQNASELIDAMESSGVSYESFIFAMQAALIWKNSEDPLLFVIGTPMRGISGERDLKQHLCAWEFDNNSVDSLKLSLEKFSKYEPLKEIGEKGEKLFRDWMALTKINWCKVYEDRGEIVTRRDHSSSLSSFNGMKVSLWGCGAIGANIALHLARAGIKEIILRDKDVVTPGVLVRQPYREADIGHLKVDALGKRIKEINSSIKIKKYQGNIKNWLLKEADWTDAADIVLDCTASNMVHAVQEYAQTRSAQTRVPIVSMIIDGACERGLVVMAGEHFTGGVFDVYRKALLRACRMPNLTEFANKFFPHKNFSEKQEFFQPEPGCSDPTFIGSSSDSASLASLMLDCACQALTAKSDEGQAFLLTRNLNKNFEYDQFSFPKDRITIDRVKDYQVRVSTVAWKKMHAEIKKSVRKNGLGIETGGLLYGQRDDVLKIIWIDEATEAPPDSEVSSNGFICGVEGIEEQNVLKKKRSRNLSKCLGTWHTHPDSSPFPSDVDLNGISQILFSEDNISRKKNFLLIVQPVVGMSKIGGYLFDKADFDRGYLEINGEYYPSECSLVTSTKQKIGLSLSGGGSRAIAFHLGCFRALNDRGLLEQVDVISSVSGGSVIAALYAYSNESYEEFDKKIVKFLKAGLECDVSEDFFMSTAWAKELLQYLTKFPVSVGCRVLKKKFQMRRNSYRTLSFINALQKKLFGDAKISDPRRRNLNTVINATELRTGSAFRFGSKESGCWRIGRIKGNDVCLAEAVALSAAYPLFLPALDKDYTFVKGKVEQGKRVVMSDGGVFDNLGVTCLEPGRNPNYSLNSYNPDYIICCNAGYGMLGGDFIPFGLASRLKQVLETTMRKVQDSSMKRLHQYKDSGQLKGFVMPYLGQNNNSLPLNIPDLVPRDDVDYPTNFSRMSSDDIFKISTRGEQLTSALLDYYHPEL